MNAVAPDSAGTRQPSKNPGEPSLEQRGAAGDAGATEWLAAELRQRETLLDVVQRVQRHFIREKSIRASATALMMATLEVTGAEYGFIGEVLRDENGKTYLQTYYATDISWNEQTRAIYRDGLINGMQFRNHNTLFGHTLRTGETVISNTPRSHPASVGIPVGHPPLNTYAGIPVYSGETMVGMIGLANRPGGFDEAIIARLEPLITTFAVMVEAQQAEQERDAAVLRMRETKSRLRAMANGIPGAVCQWLTRGPRFLRMAFASAGLRQLTGCDPELAQRSTTMVLRCLAPGDRRALLLGMRRNNAAGTAWSMEFALRIAGRSEPTWVRLAVQPHALPDGNIEWNAVAVDIGETKRMEEQLRTAKDEADAANRAKSAFLATMSHEIRTPIHAMLGYIELLQRSPLQSTQLQQLSVVGDSTRSLLSLLDDILDFSRIEAGKLNTHREPANVHQLLARNLGVWNAAAARKGLRLVLDSTLPESLEVMIDPVRTRQILINLMSNAIKFTDRGAVTLSADWLAASASGEPQIRFTVRDTGIGMSREVQARIFAPFEQGDGETTRRHGGSGLGLAISRRLAELLGGSLELDSEPNHGTAVTVVLPALAAQVHKGSTGTVAATVPAAAAKVLVVDDNEANRGLLVCQLEQLGQKPTAVGDGLAALAAWQQQDYDLILTDCHMPGMDGWQLARTIRACEAGRGRRAVPIIALTADAYRETETTCAEAGMSGYLAKPLGITDLGAMLAQHLRQAPPTAAAPVVEAAQQALPMLDLAVLDRVTGGLGSLRARALELFARTVPAELERLREAVAASHRDDIAAFSHSLTGSARTVGATPLANACTTLNRDARASLGDHRSQLAEIDTLAAATLSAVAGLQHGA